MTGVGWRRLLVALVAASLLASCGGGRQPATAGPSTIVPFAPPPASAHTGERFESQSSAATAEGAAWEFAEGLSIRITGVRRLPSAVGALARGDVRLVLVRVDFSYTNNGAAVHLSDGRQQPVRLLYGPARDEAPADAGYAATSDQLTLQVPTVVESGAVVHGAGSFAVPVAGADVLAVLVVEPLRYTEHLFTEVERLAAA